MTISKRQFDHLTEMGIQLWQRKSLVVDNNKVDCNTRVQPIIEINYPTLAQSQIFNDVLICLGISSSDVTHDESHLQLGLLTWKFGSEKSITIENNTLTTPTFSTIIESNSLKAELWQAIHQNNLL